MSKRSRRHARNTPPPWLPPPRPADDPQPSEPEPERLLLDQIAAGELDAHLHAIADAIQTRVDLLETINSAKALAMLNVGDRVRSTTTPDPNTCKGSKGS